MLSCPTLKIFIYKNPSLQAWSKLNSGAVTGFANVFGG